ncbi:amino acid adenylation domain-containing protein, partial [Fulvivirga kasyanovii]|uniref:non-ribosomal peptide synthetase n=1 Tax=Fulvivirga kasyanovii TaxID=396812 RepID=UPI0031D5E90F
MNITSLILKLKDKKIKLVPDQGQLKIQAPEGALTPDIINDIKSNKEQLIHFLSGAAVKEEVSIPKAPDQEYYDLSFAQQSIWVASQIPEVKVAYNMPQVYTIEQKLNIDAVSKALDALVKRHESLRTIFIMVGDEPKQKILEPAQSKHQLSYIDLRSEKDAEARARELVSRGIKFSFDLENGPLINLELMHITDEKFVLLLNMHHIISDAWSLDVIMNELIVLHDTFAQGKSDPLPPLKLHYKDFALWQNGILQQDGANTHRQYWQDQFKDEIPLLDLSTDKPWPKLKTYNGYALECGLNEKLSADLKALSRGLNASMFNTFIAIVNVFLHKYCSQDDIVVGILSAGRVHADLENQVGFYINTLPVRSSIDPEKSFSSFAGQVDENVLNALEHQLYPFDRLVDDLKITRDLSRSPVFDVLVSYENKEGKYLEKSDDQGVHYLDDKEGNSKYALEFALIEFEDRIKLNIGFNSDLYEEASISRMLENLKALLLHLLHDRKAAIKTLPYISSSEKQLILEEFNDTAADFPEDKTLHQLFEEQVEKTPEAVALLGEQGSWTYQELNEKANRLANYLKSQYEIKPDTLIAAIAGSTFEKIQILLGILKSGAGYIPIEPEYPEERIRYTLEDSGSQIIVADDLEIIDKYGLHETYQVVLVNDEALNDYSVENLTHECRPTDLACLLYTSGSTGKPKGVMLEHKGLVNRIHWLWHKYDFDANDIYLQKTTYVFDVSIGEIFMTLCYGARLLTVTEEILAAPHLLAEYIEQFKPTTAHFSPTALNSFHNSLNKQDYDKLRSLRHILASGEALVPETVKKHYENTDIPLYNLFGPTEASVEVSYYETQKHDKVIPIGKPISNVKLLILDRFGGLCPVGVQGEICIGGVALARGYLNRQEQTDERFIKDPFSSNETDRLYKTGDIGRWSAEGEIEFLGRKDNQVSISGYRIELGEIESVLYEVDKVKNAAVLVVKDNSGDAGLVAYIEKVIEEEEDVDELQPLATQDEIALYNAVNATEKVYSNSNKTFKDLFELQVGKSPDKVAVIYEQTQLTYGALNARSNQLANMLQQDFNVQPGDRIGLLVDRSADMIIAVLAIIKSGAAYVPIDPEYPAERINFILGDSEVSLLLTDADIEISEKQVVNIKQRELDQYEAKNLPTLCGSNDLAYIIYTSGSTGYPKGVMVEHHSLTNVAEAWREAYRLDELDVSLLQMASVAFDVFTGDLCRVLLYGGQMVICPKETRLDPANLYALMDEYQINIFEATPALIVPFLQYVYEHVLDISFLKLLILGSDVIAAEEFKRIVSRYGKKFRIINSYGTTETTIDSCFYELISGETLESVNTPIGKPLANTKFYILNESMEQVAVNVPGELYIGGEGVARGYWNRADLTRERFMPDPFDQEKRIYKTGDQARWLEDGNVEFLGRLDRQVKLRGYRIEMGEIENTLLKHNMIRQAAVIELKEDNETKQLCAYYTATQDLTIKELRASLGEHLPDFMIPSHFIKLDSFPLTPNGKVDYKALPKPTLASANNFLRMALKEHLSACLPKYMVPTTFVFLDNLPKTSSGKIDRKALPHPDFSNVSTGSDYVAPETELQRNLVEIWKEILLREKIGITDNFFDLGGHSLKATRVVSQVYKQLGLQVSLREVFLHPTVGELSKVLEEKEQEGYESISRVADQPYYEISHAQRRLWVLDQF